MTPKSASPYYAIQQGYRHAEAFALMPYACKVCGNFEWLWNSRDGVTPFCISCTHNVCNAKEMGPMSHRMGFDIFALPDQPIHQPHLDEFAERAGTQGIGMLAAGLGWLPGELFTRAFHPRDGMRVFIDMSLEHAAQIAESRMLQAPEYLPPGLKEAYYETSPNGDLTILNKDPRWLGYRNGIAEGICNMDADAVARAKAGGYPPGGAPATITWPLAGAGHAA